MERTGIDCFAGIGGFSLAMRNCGIEPKVQIEIDEYCQKVLEKNFPKVKRFRDISAVSANDLRRYRPWIVCGGFPCQDVSAAGKGKGANEGERSGLWREMWRLIRTTRPTWLLIENVPALRTRGADSVLVALEALGYTPFSLVVGALHVGAPHRRQRVWIVAYADHSGFSGSGLSEIGRKNLSECDWSSPRALGDRDRERHERQRRAWPAGRPKSADADFQFAWEAPRLGPESELARIVDGISGRLDKHRIKALGNAIVPQVAEAILRSIIAVEEQLTCLGRRWKHDRSNH